MRAAGQGTQPGAVRGLDIGELLQSLEYERMNFAADDQIKSCQRIGGERRKTPPIHFDQPILRAVRIGGESGEDHSSLEGPPGSSSPTPPAPSPPGALTPRCSFTRASTSADISGWSLR